MIFTGLQRSLSRLELTVATIIMVILIGLFLRQILVMAARAERHFLEATVINMNTALYYHASILNLKGQQAELEKLASSDPFQLMQNAVFNMDIPEKSYSADNFAEQQYQFSSARYKGDLSEMTSPEPGNWYFDRVLSELVYFVSNDEFFFNTDSEVANIRFRIKLDFEDTNKNDKYDAGTDIYKGVELKDMGGYRWEI